MTLCRSQRSGVRSVGDGATIGEIRHMRREMPGLRRTSVWGYAYRRNASIRGADSWACHWLASGVTW
jgi:hypothetical protein